MKNTQLSKMAITLLIGSILTSVTLQAGWIKGAKYAYNVLDGFGTWSFYSELLENEIFKPNRADAKLRARPSLETYEKATMSGVYHGDVWDEKVEGYGSGNYYTLAYAGNYAHYRLSWMIVEWDEEDEIHLIAQGAGGSSNGPHWWSKNTWESLVNSPGAAEANSWLDYWFTGDGWARPGFWITIGSSIKLEYPDVKIVSEVWNPAAFGTVLDGQLLNEAKTFGGSGLTYTSKVHFELQELEWVSGTGGTGYWKAGKWVKNDPDLFMNTFPAYKNDQDTWPLCPSGNRIRNETVKGGIDIRWNENINYVNAVVETQPLDEQGNLTGEIKRHEGAIQKDISYVITFDTVSPN